MKRLLLLLALLFVGYSFLYAGETGKIAGRVIDSQTKETLFGANILIIAKWVDGKEQSLEIPIGASTDSDGRYFILNVSPGLYNIQASYIGYQSQIITEVSIDIDKTTTIDFQLSPQEIVTGEVTVSAFSPGTVEPDVTATKQTYNTRDIQEMAGVANISDILELQVDVVDDHFRGGRIGESSYLISGGSIVNPLTNQRAFSPIVTGLDQVEVYTSGFSAEYGNAQSGVVNMVARQGGEIWTTRMEAAVIPPYSKTWNGSPYSSSNLYFYDMLIPTVAWLEENPTQPGRPLFDAGYGFEGVYLPPRNVWPPDPLLLADSLHIARLGQISWMQSIRDVGLEYNNMPDVRIDFTTGGPIAKNVKIFLAGRINSVNPKIPTTTNDNLVQIMSNLTYQASTSDKIGFRIVYDHSNENYLNSNWRRWLFDRTFSVTQQTQTTFQFSIDWNHIFNQSTIMDIKFNVLNVIYSENVELLQDGEFLEDYSNRTNWVDYTGPSSHRVGRVNDDVGEEQTYSYNLQASLLSQIGRHNLVKAGFQFSYYDMLVDRDMNITNEGSFRKVSFNSFPYEGALYIQDKLELDGFIANIGLRFDVYNFNTEYYADIFSPLRNPNYDPEKPYLERGKYYDPELAALDTTEIYTRLQPRIGFSFPLSETTVFHLNYGTFTQRPQFDAVYYNQVTMFDEIIILGNARLRPENTKAYDIGLVQAFPGGIKVDLSAYYKDVSDLIQSAFFYDDQQQVYQTFVNRDYADITGFHVSLEKNLGAFRGFIKYNYQAATGKSSNALDAPITLFENPPEGQDPVELPDPEDVFMDYDRSHKFIFNIRYITPVSTSVFSDMSFSLTYKYFTGRPYTWDDTGQGLKFNQRTPDENDLRMRIEKRIKIANSKLTLYLEGFNLLNEEIFHYSRTFNSDRNTPKWENDRENILVYDEFYPYTTDQSVYLLSNLPRHFRIGAIIRF